MKIVELFTKYALVLALLGGIFALGVNVGERDVRSSLGGPFFNYANPTIEMTPPDGYRVAMPHVVLASQTLPPPNGVTPVGPAPAPTPTPTLPALGATIIGLAALVTTVLQGVKNLFPAINGWGARIIAVALAIAGAITAAPAGQPPLVTAGAAATAALASMGIYGLAKKPAATP